jgi:hypothetical protein
MIGDWNKMRENKSEQELASWRKKIEMIGIEIKGLDQETETGRFKLKTKLMNEHFIKELDKVGLQVINIRASFIGRLVVLLEGQSLNSVLS